MRIFLSYGHDAYVSMASRLKRDLQALGHDVWFDLERLRPGSDWEQYIEEGLERVAEDGQNGRFLLLMTPHSVRRPDGYCLNELARAFSRNLPIIPLMVSTVEVPLSICRLQWLDMRQCFPVEQHEEQYGKQFPSLAAALALKQVPFEGVQQRLLNYLNPDRYDDDVQRYLARFTGRQWVMREFQKWLASSHRVLWITGEPGVGKSAVAAWLCTQRPEIVACHFCRFGNSARTDARKALFSLAYQLSTQLPVYQGRLNALPLDKIVAEAQLPAVFDRLFVEILNDAVPIAETPHILLIDALDEASRNGGNDLADLIGSELNRMPGWFRMIVTSRPHEQEVNFPLQSLDPWKLDAGRPENLQDIREYLNRELRPFADGKEVSPEIVDLIVERSEGLFLYVSWVRQELQDDRLSLERVEEFPRGLGGVYADFFRRYFPDLRGYEADCRPALEAICAIREPLEPGELAALLGWPEYKMHSLAAQLGSLFPVTDGRVRPFHQSVRDWLIDAERAGPYWIDIAAQEQRLARLAWREYQEGIKTMGRYCITYGPSHLAASRMKSELETLLLDPDWIQAKLPVAGFTSLLADYDLALSIFRPKPSATLAATAYPVARAAQDPEAGALEVVQGAIRMSSHVIARDPGQFASQMVGRLLPSQKMPAIAQFIAQVVQTTQTPWLRPLRPALDPPGTPLIRRLQGHSDEVNGVALSWDGRRAFSASKDHTVKVWDVESGRELRTFAGHYDSVLAVALSADGRCAISGGDYGGIRVWDVESGQELRRFEWPYWTYEVALSGDGRIAASAHPENTLKVWDVESGTELHTLGGHTKNGCALALSTDGKRAVSAHDKTLKVWDVESGQELRTLEDHSGVFMALTSDGKFAVSASGVDLTLWEVESGRELRAFQGGFDGVEALALSVDGRRAVSAHAGNTLKVWDMETGQELRTLQNHSDPILAMALSGDGRTAVSADRLALKVWNVESPREPPILTGHFDSVKAIALSGEGRLAISASLDRTLKVWNAETGKELRTLQNHHPVVSVALSRDGRIAACCYLGSNALKVWDVETGRELRTLLGHSDGVRAVALSADGRLAASVSWDWTLKVWNVERGRARLTVTGFSGTIALSNDGSLAVTTAADSDGTIKVLDVNAKLWHSLKVWRRRKGRELHTLQGHSYSAVEDVALTGGGKLAVSASSDRTLKVWDVETGRELRILLGHSDSVRAVALSADGRWAVSASDDRTVRVWDVEEGKAIAIFTCDGTANCCAFHDRLVIAGDGGGRVYFLRVEGSLGSGVASHNSA